MYDMHGNVNEWCKDWYGDYSSTAVENPTGPNIGTNCIFRSSSWLSTPYTCRSAYRPSDTPSTFANSIGFRLVLVYEGGG